MVSKPGDYVMIVSYLSKDALKQGCRGACQILDHDRKTPKNKPRSFETYDKRVIL